MKARSRPPADSRSESLECGSLLPLSYAVRQKRQQAAALQKMPPASSAGQAGMIYAAVLLLVLLASVMGLAFVHTVTTQSTGMKARTDGLQAHYLAESAAHHAMWLLLNTEMDSMQSRVDETPGDAFEDNGGSAVIDSWKMPLGEHPYLGLRFRNINIPQGASITSAKIYFTASNTDSLATSLRIEGENANNASIFQDTHGNLSSRPRVTPFVSWPNVSSWIVDGTYSTPDLSPIVQQIITRPGWTNGNAIVFLVRPEGAAGRRRIYSADDTPALAPLLKVEYDPSGNASVSSYRMFALAGGRYGYKVRPHTETTFATVATVGAVDDTVVRQSYVLNIIPDGRRSILISYKNWFPVTDYPVKVTLTPTNMGSPYEDVDPSGNDLRFVDADDNPLPFWIENWDINGDSIVWVKVPSIPGGDSYIYMTSGDSAAPGGSNGDATFMYFEDFEGYNSGDVPNGWDFHEDKLQVRNDGGRMVFDDGDEDQQNVVANHANFADVAVRQTFRRVKGSVSRPSLLARYVNNSHVIIGGVAKANLGSGDAVAQIYQYIDGARYQVGLDWNISGFGYGWHVQELAIDGTSVKLSIDDRFVGEGQLSRKAPTSGRSGFMGQSEDCQGYRDWHLVRKYTNPEPVAVLQ